MKRVFYSVFFLMLLSFSIVSCGNSNSNNSGSEYSEYEGSSVDDEDEEEADLIDCPMCNSSGVWYNPQDGQGYRCELCGGSGKAPREQAEEIARFFQSIGGNGQGSFNSGNDADAIQREIDMYNQQIAQMQEMLDNTSSGVYQAYYSQEIINLQYKVKELENKLRYMSE